MQCSVDVKMEVRHFMCYRGGESIPPMSTLYSDALKPGAPAGTWADLASPVAQIHRKREVEAQLTLASPAGPVTRLPDPRAPVQWGSWQKWVDKSGTGDCLHSKAGIRGKQHGTRCFFFAKQLFYVETFGECKNSRLLSRLWCSLLTYSPIMMLWLPVHSVWQNSLLFWGNNKCILLWSMFIE